MKNSKFKHVKRSGMGLARFVILWVFICVLTAAVTVYADEIKEIFFGLSDYVKSVNENSFFPSAGGEQGRNIGGFNIAETENPDITDTENSENSESSEGTKSSEGLESPDNSDTDGRLLHKKDIRDENETSLPALNSVKGKSPKIPNEELKMPVKALTDFLKTDDIKYLYRVIPPDCIEFLKQKYAAGIAFMGGESNAVKAVIEEKLNDYEAKIGKLTDISCDIREVSELDETKLPELDKNLQKFGSNSEIERAFLLRLVFCFRSESDKIEFYRTVRIIKTDTGWFVYPEDLIQR